MASLRALPAPATPLLGREADVAAIVADLDEGGRLVVLTGPPGVGKTRLAVGVAAAVADRFRDGVAWVDLTPVRDPAVVVDEVVHATGLTHATDLHDRQLLVVLDNCEHVLAAAPAVAALVAGHPGLIVLATSRERLRVTAEREHSVLPLPIPSPEALTDLRRLATNPAVALVLGRAPAYVALTAATARPLIDICCRLDGLPLALEFAAARLRVFTPGELAFRLEQRTGELTDGARDTPARHRDLRSAIAWSHDLLPDAERAVFRRLAVFEGSWTATEAEAVAGGPDAPDVLAALESLLDKSLVRRADDDDVGPARFALLVSLREYAAEQLAQHGDEAATRRRHAVWFAGVARAWEATIGTGEEDMTWRRSGLIRGDLESALATAASPDPQTRDPESTLWLQAGLSWYWYTRGSPVHAADLVPTEDDLSAGSSEAAAAVLVATGAVAFASGDLEVSKRRLEQAHALSQPGGHRRRSAFATAFLGHVGRELGRHDAAAEHYRQARAIYTELGNARGVAWAACDLGLLTAEQGDAEPAEQLLREALDVFESLDYPWAVAVATCGLAAVQIARGDADTAAVLARHAFELHAGVDDVRGVAQSLEVLADVSLARGAGATAARLLGAAAARRDRVAARATAAERTRVQQSSLATSRVLGSGEAAREERAGRALTDAAVRGLVERLTASAADASAPHLTERQHEVAALVAGGRTNRQIARELGISEKTAELHVRNAIQRLGVQNRAGVAAWVATRSHADG